MPFFKIRYLKKIISLRYICKFLPTFAEERNKLVQFCTVAHVIKYRQSYADVPLQMPHNQNILTDTIGICSWFSMKFNTGEGSKKSIVFPNFKNNTSMLKLDLMNLNQIFYLKSVLCYMRNTKISIIYTTVWISKF